MSYVGKEKKILSRALVTISILMLAVGSIILAKQTLISYAIPGYSDRHRPVKSFIFVQRASHLELVACIPIKESGIEDCMLLQNDKDLSNEVVSFFDHIFSYSIRGSAVLVGHDQVRNTSYVLTAHHVCKDFEPRYLIVRTLTNNHLLMFRFEPAIELTDFYGNTYDGSITRVDVDNDLCLLDTENMLDHIEPVRIARSPPEAGDRIFNVASPHSLSQPGAVLSYEGYHAGNSPGGRLIKDPHYLNAIATAPGSSGSPILNEYGEVISIISYGFTQQQRSNVMGIYTTGMWPNASGGPSLDAVQNLVQSRIIQ